MMMVPKRGAGIFYINPIYGSGGEGGLGSWGILFPPS